MPKPKPASPLATNTQYQKILALIVERRCRCMWQIKGPEMAGGASVLEAWCIPGCTAPDTSIILVHVFPDEGIDLYVNGTPHDWTEIAAWLGPTEKEQAAMAQTLRECKARDAAAGDP